MPESPLALSSVDFDLLGTAVTEDDVAKKFVAKVKRLHRFLNTTSVVHDLQVDRKSWTRPQSRVAFENFGRNPRHWYTYHHGGRNEAQLNIGMFAGDHQHVRIGLGFEGTTRQGGDPSAVAFVYTAFVKLLRGDDPVARGFRSFAATASLEVEFWNLDEDRLELVPASNAVEFLARSTAHFAWIFVGRLLRRNDDADLLNDPTRLPATIDQVFGNIRPIWRLTNQRGRALSG